MSVLFIIAGYILQHNGQWFNEADTVGGWLFYGGIVLLVIEVVFYLFVFGVFGAIAGSEYRRSRRRW